MSLKVTSKLPEKTSLSEIYQSTNLQMAILTKVSDNEYERITPFVKCRDFLTDVFSYSKSGQKLSIYGMTFDGEKQSADFSGVYLLLQLPDKAMAELLGKQLKYINAVEKKNGVKETTYREFEKLQFVVDGPSIWVQNCLSFSLYSLLIRALCSKIVGKGDWVSALAKVKENTDAALLASVNPSVWKKVFADLKSISTTEYCGFPAKTNDIGTVHHNSGFISVFGQHREINFATMPKNSHWQEMRERGFKLHPKSVEAHEKNTQKAATKT